MTGGLQEQVTDGEKWFGFGIEPSSKAIIGSQDVPYIYEDRIAKEAFLDAMLKFYNMSKDERRQMGQEGRKHVVDNYNFATFAGNWYEAFNQLFDHCGSWDTRKNYKNWRIEEIC
jgi:glycosyltransferase involved in cell wall biosynthesis